MTCTHDILEGIKTLPPLPDTVLRLVRVTNNPSSEMRDVVESIRYDQAVTAEILRVCNSPYFGLPRNIKTLDEATRYLGMLKVLHLVLSLHTNVLLAGGQAGYGLAPGALWRHSVAVALGCSIFADRLSLEGKGVAFTAGLLHDIGKVVLHQHVRDEFDKILSVCKEQHISFTEAELQVLGCSHEEIGAELAARWQLPEGIVRCIRHHKTPSKLDPADPLVDIVYLSDCVALMLGVGIGNDELLYRADGEVLTRLGLHESDLEMAGAKMLMELRAIEKAFVSFEPMPALQASGHQE